MNEQKEKNSTKQANDTEQTKEKEDPFIFQTIA